MVNKYSNPHGIDYPQRMAPHGKVTRWPPASEPSERDTRPQIYRMIFTSMLNSQRRIFLEKQRKSNDYDFPCRKKQAAHIRLEAILYDGVQATGG